MRPLRGRNDAPAGFVLVFHDTTEARRARAALEESEARFRVLADQMPLPLWMSDEARGYVYVNPAWWNKLSPANRQAIEAAAAKAEQDSIPITEATAADALKELKAKGMQIHVQTPQEEAAWKAVMEKPVVDAFLKSAPADGAKVLDLLHKL